MKFICLSVLAVASSSAVEENVALQSHVGTMQNEEIRPVKKKKQGLVPCNKDGSIPLTKAVCEDYATATYGKKWQKEVCRKHQPKGCYFLSNGKVYFNTHSEGKANKKSTPVCKRCDKDMNCLQALSCFDGVLYPTSCGPANCDKSLGACGGEAGTPCAAADVFKRCPQPRCEALPENCRFVHKYKWTTGSDPTQSCPVPCAKKCSPRSICDVPKKVGKCKAMVPKGWLVPRWYFDSKKGKCKKFLSGGCGERNKNNFDTYKNCNERTKECSPRSICNLPKKVGNCRAKIQKWYFDSKERKCKQFSYGGCDANKNNFDCKNDCMDAAKECSLRPICNVPKKVGKKCKASKLRWYFDSKKGKCKKFLWGGCGEPNSNNFGCKKDCRDAAKECC